MGALTESNFKNHSIRKQDVAGHHRWRCDHRFTPLHSAALRSNVKQIDFDELIEKEFFSRILH